jgi:16S rRNA (cytosine967-C5)-methyltransferase
MNPTKKKTHADNTVYASTAGSNTGSNQDKPQKKFIDYGRDTQGVQRRRKPKNVSENYVLRLNMIDAAAQVLDEIQTFTHPADAMLAHYFRRNAHLGQRDRAWISALVWHVLRHKRLLAQIAQSGAGSFSRRLAQLALARTQGLAACQLHATADEYTWLTQMLSLPVENMSPAIQASLPDWLYAALQEAYSPEQLARLCPALLEPAGLVLRVNTLKSDRDAVMKKLTYKQIPAAVHALTPWAIALQSHPNLAKLDAYNDGLVEVQDAGSQVLAMLTDAKRGQMVADFCAGAGGKTLALGAMMRNTGRLYAFDVNSTRLKRLQPRLARSGLSNIAPIVIDSESDPKIKRLAGKFDSVLIDAPCSGMGTLRRNPDLKWRQHPRDVTELAAKQTRILASAARLVKIGGRLVYATCSVLPAENQQVVQAFLALNPQFTLLPAAAECNRLGVQLPPDALYSDGMLQLLPTNHTANAEGQPMSCDGFFAAVMVRQTSSTDAEQAPETTDVVDVTEDLSLADATLKALTTTINDANTATEKPKKTKKAKAATSALALEVVTDAETARVVDTALAKAELVIDATAEPKPKKPRAQAKPKASASANLLPNRV